MTRGELAALIDHTILKAEATEADVVRVCDEAREFGCAAVCVNGAFVPRVVRELHGTAVRACAVAGFPLGAMATRAKADEARRAVADGADEIDMVLALGRFLGGDVRAAADDVAAVRAACPGASLKVILESAVLPGERLAAAARIAVDAGADLVKTSTGFHPAGGASVEAVRALRAVVGDDAGVKASGGIRDTATALAMVDAGARRLGLSGTRAVLDGLGDSVRGA